MRLTGPDGHEFELTILGYEFPGIEQTPGDSNWLMVNIRVKHPRGSWEATGPFLRTTEVAQLATWFDGVAVEAPMINRETWIESGRPQVAGFPNLRLFDSAEFLEPNLRFALVESTGENAVVRVYFELKARPPWSASVAAGQEDLYIDLRLSRSDLKSAAESLRTFLTAFLDRALTTEPP